MLFDVNRMQGALDRIERTADASTFEAEEAYRLAAPVRMSIDVHKDDTKLRLKGFVATTLELTCSRCLEGYPVPVDATFDLMYLPHSEAPGDEDIEVTDGDANTAFYRDGVIDLGELVREQIYLTLPMKPLCREDCRGLCPECGTNLNAGTCACAHRWEDPRLAPLKSLLNTNDDA
jgi:uncharacterized protein